MTKKKHMFGDNVVPCWSWIMDVAKWLYDHDRDEYHRLTSRNSSEYGSDRIFRGMMVKLKAEQTDRSYGTPIIEPTCVFAYGRKGKEWHDQFVIRPMMYKNEAHTSYRVQTAPSSLRTTSLRHLPFNVRGYSHNMMLYTSREGHPHEGPTTIRVSGLRQHPAPVFVNDSTGKAVLHPGSATHDGHDSGFRTIMSGYHKASENRGPRFLAGECGVKDWLRSLASPPLFERDGVTLPLWDVTKTLALAGTALKAIMETQRQVPDLKMAVRYMPLRHKSELPSFKTDTPGMPPCSDWQGRWGHGNFQIGNGGWVKTELRWGLLMKMIEDSFWIPKDDRLVRDFTGWSAEVIAEARTHGTLKNNLIQTFDGSLYKRPSYLEDLKQSLYVDWPAIHLDFGNIKIQNHEPYEESTTDPDGTYAYGRGLATNGFSLKLIPFIDNTVVRVTYEGKVGGGENGTLTQDVGGLFKIKCTKDLDRDVCPNKFVYRADPATMMGEIQERYALESIPMF